MQSVAETAPSPLKSPRFSAIFGHDMVFDIKTLIDWKSLSDKKQMSNDKLNLRENAIYALGTTIQWVGQEECSLKYIVQTKVRRS